MKRPVSASAVISRLFDGCAFSRNRPSECRSLLKTGIDQQVCRFDLENTDHGVVLSVHICSSVYGIAARSRPDCRRKRLCIPVHRSHTLAAVIVGNRYRPRQGNGFRLIFKHCHADRALHRFHLFLAGGSGIHIAEHLKGFQRVSVKVKQCLIIHCGAAVPLRRIALIFSRMDRCPAGAVLLPFLLVGGKHLGSIVRLCVIHRHRNPCRLPVKDADTGIAHIGNCLHHIPDFLCLSLHRHGILHGQTCFALQHRILMSVAVLIGISVRGLRHHHFFSVGVRNILQYGSQVAQRAVPDRIVGAGKHIIVHAVSEKGGCNGRIPPRFLRVCKVKRHLDLPSVGGCHRTHGAAARIHQLADIAPVRLTAEPARGLISHLYHAHVHTGVQKGLQGTPGKVRNRSFLLLNTVIAPRLGRRLLCGIRPEIRIMEIDQHPHARLRGKLSHGYCLCKVIVSASVAVSVPVIRVVPHTDSHIIDTTLLEESEESCPAQRIARKILERDTAVHLRKIGGHIHALDKVITHAGHTVDQDPSLHWRNRLSVVAVPA